MSAPEVTAAYVRAIEAAAGSYSTPEGVADAVLAAALDVEEMARALYEHDATEVKRRYPDAAYRPWVVASARRRAPYEEMATALRAALLGAGQ